MRDNEEKTVSQSCPRFGSVRKRQVWIQSKKFGGTVHWMIFFLFPGESAHVSTSMHVKSDSAKRMNDRNDRYRIFKLVNRHLVTVLSPGWSSETDQVFQLS
jgi:hypothetical protein